MKNIIILLTFSLLLASCQKVVDLSLDSSAAQLVIQGTIYNGDGPFNIRISKTVNFYDSNSYPPVTNALVIISDNHGIIDTLNQVSEGNYQTKTIKGIAGYTYTLRVLVDGNAYSATSTMPDPIGIDSLYLDKAMFGNDRVANIKFQDPANIDNYYRIIEFLNSVPQSGFHAMSDKNYNGKLITYKISSRNNNDKDKTINNGDSITVWLETIDKGVYEYFRTISNQNGQSASPANPTSNITNGAFGYFSACSVTRKSMVAPIQ